MPTSTGNRENCSANGTSSWITGVVDQPGTDRSEQTTPQRTLAAAADHHHLSLFGQVDKCWHGHRKEQFTVDLGARAVLGAVFDDLDRVGDDLPAVVFLPLAVLFGKE